MKRTVWSAVSVVLVRMAVVASVVLPFVARAQKAASVKPVAVVPMEAFLGRGLTVTAKVNGVEGTFLFDTGAGLTHISPGMATKIGCKPWGRMTGFTMQGQRIESQHCDGLTVEVSGQKLELPVASVGDIMKRMPPGAPHLDGVLALDAFAGRQVSLSLTRKTLTIESAGSLAAVEKKATAVPVRLVRDAEGAALEVTTAVKTSAGTAWMEIDSGNASPVCVLGKHLAELFGADAEKHGPQAVDVRLANGTPVDAQFAVLDLTMDGNLGTVFLQKWDVTFDLAKGKGWISPSS